MPFGTTTTKAQIVSTATTTTGLRICATVVGSAPLTATPTASLNFTATIVVSVCSIHPIGAINATNAPTAWRKRTAPPAANATSARMTSYAANAIRVHAAP